MRQVGLVYMGGLVVGRVCIEEEGGAPLDSFVPNTTGYEPMGRADIGIGGHQGGHGGGSSGSSHAAPRRHHYPGHHSGEAGKSYTPSEGGPRVRRGSASTDAAIEEAAKAYNLNPHFMRATASIESGMNPASNADKSTQYKGLYQVGHNEWDRFGEGDIYNARDNAMAAGRMFSANRDSFTKKFGRGPTDTELYMMHQQGLGFYTRGAMTNIEGNPYPGMHGAQDHDSFEAGWGREIERRKNEFSGQESQKSNIGPPTDGNAAGGGRYIGGIVRGVDPRIQELVAAGATHLPPGYTVSMTSGFRSNQTPNHNGNAADFHITDPSGNVLRNRGEDPDGMYQQLARHTYGEMLERHPDLKGDLAWGGAFGTALGGGGERDLMHFDINGERGRYSQYQLSRMGAVPGVQYGRRQSEPSMPIQHAAAAAPNTEENAP